MSLDVYLKYSGETYKNRGSGIFIRRGGSTVEITKEEWDELRPGEEPHTYKTDEIDYVFHANITHNLKEMADKADLAKPLWHPDALSIKNAVDLIPYLEKGLAKLTKDIPYFKQFNPTNGWGDYEGLFKFVLSYLTACIQYPNAVVEVSR